jgi:microcystin-dependent protein
MEPFIAQIIMFGGNFAPRGWAFCDGQLLPISQNSALFSLLGTTYGGDGRTTFGLPDLRGRVAIHPGNGPGLSSYRQGQKGGSETNTLTTNQLPSHNHAAAGTAKSVSGEGDTAVPTDKYPAKSGVGDPDYGTTPDGSMAAGGVDVTVQNTGGGQSVNNIQPYGTVQFIIALQGTFPSRN